MRIVESETHPAILRAARRRRVWLALFGAFLLASIFSLLWAGLHFGRRNPPRDLRAAADALAPDAVWMVALDPFPGELLAALGLDADPIRRLEVRSRLLQGSVAIVQFAPDNPKGPGWAAFGGIDRPARLHRDVLWREAEPLVRGAAPLARAEASRLAFAAASDAPTLREAMDAHASAPLEARWAEQAAWMRYEGPASLLPDRLAARLAEAFAELDGAPDFEDAWGLDLEWGPGWLLDAVAAPPPPEVDRPAPEPLRVRGLPMQPGRWLGPAKDD